MAGIPQKEAAQTVAIEVAVFARKYNQEVTMLAIWEHISEMQGGHKGEYRRMSAKNANIKTVKRFVRESLTTTGHSHLIAF